MTANAWDLLTETRTMADLTVGGQITPTTLAATTNNYNPTHGPVSGVLCISSSSAIDLTGLLAPEIPILRRVINVGAFVITLLKNDAGSLAANRFQMGGASHSLLPGQGAEVYYHAGLARWVLMNESVTAAVSPVAVCIIRTISSALAIAAGTTCLQRRPLIAAGVGVTIEAGGEWLIL
jgi:hypothetical protein